MSTRSGTSAYRTRGCWSGTPRTRPRGRSRSGSGWCAGRSPAAAASPGALAHHDVALEGIDVLDEHRVAVGEPIGPLRGARIGFRGAHDPEVPRGVVGVDQEEIPGMLDAVLDVWPPCGDHAGLRRR